MGVENGIAKKWPGTEFLVGAQNKKEREAAAALIGTLPSTRRYGSADYAGFPNLLAGGYFLLQHKLQLGRKFLTKVRIWQSDEEIRNIPNRGEEHGWYKCHPRTCVPSQIVVPRC
jgi:hypothetical protein